MFERQSALAVALESNGRDGPDGGRRLQIGEQRGWSLVQVAAFASTVTALETVIRSVLHAELPARVGEIVNVDGRRVLRTGATQYWILAPEADQGLRGLSIPADVGAVSTLSHSRTCLFIEGNAASEVLATAAAVDFHAAVFGVDRFVLTGLHHVPVLIHRSGQSRYELYVMRTYAQSLWDWLTDAALPFGYDIGASTTTAT